VCLVEHRKETSRCETYKNLDHVFVKCFNRGVFGWFGLPAKINNPVPARQVRFQQFHVIERFYCVEGNNKRNNRGAL